MVRMHSIVTRLLLALVVAMITASPAFAGKSVATPALRVPGLGGARCTTVNVSDDTIRYTYSVKEFDGSEITGATFDLLPHQSLNSGLVSGIQVHCEVAVVSGSTKSIRVTLQIFDSGNNPVDSVEGR